ncbi:Cyanovirin-N [Teratosphaeria destructans]|uniref:Cyanovirin-N n=1 Tax=Teratosphaeria destructans TaxID=418781 RepID=A0A9W7SPY0_9PEZI|nr:Cyanovirin-N [Teratosphaeria destructans]
MPLFSRRSSSNSSTKSSTRSSRSDKSKRHSRDLSSMAVWPSTCRNVRLEVTPYNVYLHALCRRDDGTWRQSKIDLNFCIGPEPRAWNSKDQLVPLGSWQPASLLDSNGEPTKVRKIRLVNAGATLRAEVTAYKGLSAVFDRSSRWVVRDFDLTQHVRNHDGVLEFWSLRSASVMPVWFSGVCEHIHNRSTSSSRTATPRSEVDSYTWKEQTPLDSVLQSWQVNMVEEVLHGLGWDEREIDWMKGTVEYGDYVVRLGS